MKFYADLALRINTRKTYESHHRSFLLICSAFEIEPLLALSESHLCLVCIVYAKTHKITSLPGFVSAIANFAATHLHPPLPRHGLFDRVKAGLNNFYGDTNVASPRTAITLSDLCAFYSGIDHKSFAGTRDWCACLFAFFGLLRINEYMNGGLRVQHVQQKEWGISLTIPFSKTSLHPSSIDIVHRGDELCPVGAFTRYRAFIPTALSGPTVPFFLASVTQASPLSDVEFISRVRTVISATLHCDPSSYAGHSFRRGGTTALALAGVSEATIAAHGRWSSLAYRMYFDTQHNVNIRLTASRALKRHTDDHPLPGLSRV